MTGNSEHDASYATTNAQDPWIGSVVGDRYRIEEWIGQGGMGVIYRGEHLDLGKRVAIKRLDARIASDSDSYERFRREAVAASRIESPHVVHVFDWGKAADGSPYLVMELLEGCDLRGFFAREGRLVPEQAAAITAQVLRALMRTHAAKIIHRDLKPENVYLCRYDTDELYVKLLDFGISKRTADDAQTHTMTRRGVILGTASYMSPEQARGDVDLDARSDLYSVGAILFEALTGRVPHQGRTYEAILVDICTRDADDVRLHAPLVPEPLARVVTRALKRDVSERFQSAKEFLDALISAVPELGHRVSDAPPIRVTTGSSSVRDLDAAPSRRRTGLRWAVIAVALLALMLVGAWLNRRSEGSRATLHSGAPSTRTVDAASHAPRLADSPSVMDAPTPNDSTAASTASSAGAKPSGATTASSGRPSPSRNVGPSSGVKPAPSDGAGVAPGLKLRRTMP